jgi:hypothetical protein
MESNRQSFCTVSLVPQSLYSIDSHRTSCWQEDGSVVTWGDPGAGGVPEAQQEFALRMTQNACRANE